MRSATIFVVCAFAVSGLLVSCKKGGGAGAGQEVNIDSLVVKGKTTIVDFYSEYCPPCRALSPRLEALDKKRDDIAVVKVDINRPGVKGIDWKSPVARQFELRSIPFMIVFGPDGKEQARGDEARSMVEGWL